ncbi:MAG: hypothetical protein DME22_23985 [Verrucomicrobia bacterium]|nr:MAG: hypothetical protein DME22_23985 [Verrucomicrobiota bacterium]
MALCSIRDAVGFDLWVGKFKSGWIYQPTLGFARFVPFSDRPSFQDVGDFHPQFEDYLLIAWSFRWWLLAAQVFSVPVKHVT